MVVFDNHEFLTAEEKRLKEDRHRTKYWKKWGSYLAERQWATGLSYATIASFSCAFRPHEAPDERVKSSRADAMLLQCEKIIAPTATPGAVSNTASVPRQTPSSPELHLHNRGTWGPRDHESKIGFLAAAILIRLLVLRLPSRPRTIPSLQMGRGWHRRSL